ncbi:MAG: transposase [Bacillota bacterium]
MIADSESDDNWCEFFRNLTDRGLHGVDSMGSGLSGLVKAMRKIF